jgi:hypothetical protein
MPEISAEGAWRMDMARLRGAPAPEPDYAIVRSLRIGVLRSETGFVARVGGLSDRGAFEVDALGPYPTAHLALASALTLVEDARWGSTQTE